MKGELLPSVTFLGSTSRTGWLASSVFDPNYHEKQKMIAREIDAAADVTAKQEGNTATDEKTSNYKASISGTSAAAASSSSSSWSRLKDPRIVRVSRAFGGKDRHSKVCTVRGLRDRRVRLSVPTAVQLYDLQDRLGLSQPSKVVDWLLNAAKHEIDELPPLQMPPGSFNHSFQPVWATHHPVVGAHQVTKDQGLRIGASINWGDHDHHPSEPSGSKTWDSDAILRPKSKELIARSGDSSEDKETWTRSSEEGKQHSNNYESTSHGAAYFSSNNFFSRLGHSTSPSLGLLNSTVLPYNSLIRWDPSNLSLSQSGSPSGLTPVPQPEDFHNFSVVPLPSTMSVPSGGPQVLVYQPASSITQSYFPSHIAPPVTVDYAQKQIEFQMLNSTTENPLTSSLAPPVSDSTSQHAAGRPFRILSTTTNLLPSQNDRESKQDLDNDFSSR